MKQFLTILLVFTVFSAANAQRYLTPTFGEVEVTEDITYGVNATVLFVPQAGEAVPQALTMDVYQPAGDTASQRPLIVLLHSGYGLPPELTFGPFACVGSPKDADLVNLATRLAKLGYVVAAPAYRLGWNPIAPDPTLRRHTWINAIYRGVQDSRTAIRYFRKAAAEGNPYGIDSTRVVLWGVGTGGFISLASATIDDVEDTQIAKYSTMLGPMIIEAINGNPDGTSVGIVVPGYPGFPAGDTLCYPNHVGYSSAFNLVVNMGGALGDTSWIDPDDVPMISFHVPADSLVPCGTETIKLINNPIAEVSGSCAYTPLATERGLNTCMESGMLTDPLSELARQRNGDLEGLFLFPTADPFQFPPWQYASSPEPYGVAGSNCNTNVEAADPYLDTIVQYFAPRAFLCLELETVAATATLHRAQVGLTLMPNPAGEMVTFQTSAEWPMQSVVLYDLMGRMVRSHVRINANTLNLHRENLPGGMYLTVIRFKEGIIVERIVFH